MLEVPKKIKGGRMESYHTRDKSIMSLPLVSLNKLLFLSGLAFITGVLLTIGMIG